MLKEFNVYDEVWVMKNNKPTLLLVYSVEEKMNHWKNGIDKFYRVVDGTLSADTPTNPAIGYAITNLFRSKEELMSTL